MDKGRLILKFFGGEIEVSFRVPPIVNGVSFIFYELWSVDEFDFLALALFRYRLFLFSLFINNPPFIQDIAYFIDLLNSSLEDADRDNLFLLNTYNMFFNIFICHVFSVWCFFSHLCQNIRQLLTLLPSLDILHLRLIPLIHHMSFNISHVWT